MATYTALTTLDSEAAAQALAAAMEALHPAPTGVGVLEIEDGSGQREVGGYFTEPPDQAGLALLAVIHGARPFAVSRVEDRDWVAQVRRELTPVEAGRFILYGGHDEDRIGVNRWGLKIEAAMAFGTGHHGTTRGCLLLLERLIRRGEKARKVADIGCGTGVLAMAAARVTGLAGALHRHRYRPGGKFDSSRECARQPAATLGACRAGSGVPQRFDPRAGTL
jgi:ribosomal protein L11 methyltransferase